MEQLIANIALRASPVQHLWINGLLDFIPIAPVLSSFTRLDYLFLNFFRYEGLHASGWPQPSFRLSELTFKYFFCRRDGNQPTLADFDWLVSSSRESLRDLNLEGFPPEIAADILGWGGRLQTIRFGVFYWITDGQIREVLKLATLESLWDLTLVVGPSERTHADDDEDEFEEFAARVRQAAADVNKELEMDIVEVEVWDDEDD
jgi:hypothetical protein